MIRATAVISLVILLILVLYVPASNPPNRFTNQIRLEHEAAVAYWGDEAALQILERAVVMQSQAAAAAPIPKASDAPPTETLNNAVATEMASVNQRLFNSAYFRSVDALLLMGSYRLSCLLQWLPWLLLFIVATVVDGLLTRTRKSKEFLQADPEVFAVYTSLAIITISATIAGFFLPISIQSLVFPSVPSAVFILLGRAIASYHYSQKVD